MDGHDAPCMVLPAWCEVLQSILQPWMPKCKMRGADTELYTHELLM